MKLLTKALAARSPDGATHRFPTSVKWGDGYFGDGFKYLKTTDADALEIYNQIYNDNGLSLQKRNNGQWEYLVRN